MILLKLIKTYFRSIWGILTGIASLLGIFCFFLKDSAAIILALVAFILFLIAVFITFLNVLNNVLKNKSQKGFHTFATYINYSTTDGVNIEYSLHKYVQSKVILMDHYNHEFHWTGSVYPRISSTQQDFKQFTPATKKGEWDVASFKFKTPLTYNSVGIIEVLMMMDDSDGKSKKHVGENIHSNIQLISFNIELKHLNSHSHAKILRKSINTNVPMEFETLLTVPFDEKSKSFKYSLFKPEPGYNYRLDWSSEPLFITNQ